MRQGLFVLVCMAAVVLAGPTAAGAGQASGSSASTTSAPAASIIRSDDDRLDCRQIADEAATLSQTMGGEPAGGVFGSLGGVARAGAAALIPGAGLLLAGADALTGSERERREAEARALQNRWYYLNGLYAGRRCLEDATAQPAAAAAGPPSEPESAVVVVAR